MADKNFKVKSGLNIPITSAAILTTDSSGNISSTNVLPISAGGTGQTSATNAINALLPVQNGGTVNYAIQSDGSNVNWGKLYNQTIKNNGTTVNPRGIVNVVGATFTDDSNTDTTTITFTDTTGVSTSGGSTITTSSASTKGLVIQGAASQTANLQEWQNSAGTIQALMSPFGQIRLNSVYNISSFNNAQVNMLTTGTQITSNVAANVILSVKGAASQTANLTEWQNSSGTILAKIDYAGKIIGTSDFWLSGGIGYFNAAGDTNGTFISVTTGRGNFVLQNASAVGLTVKGAASQTAHLQEWQNSTGTVIARIASTGQLVAQSIVANSFAITSSGIMHVGEVSYTAQANIKSMLASTVGLIVKGAASQTANLQEWQNSAGTVLAKVDSTGAMFTTTATAGTNTTQVATTAFVKTAIDNLIASAPGTLDTLDEIAQALNDDPNFYTTITTLTNALAEQDSYTLMGVF